MEGGDQDVILFGVVSRTERYKDSNYRVGERTGAGSLLRSTNGLQEFPNRNGQNGILASHKAALGGTLPTGNSASPTRDRYLRSQIIAGQSVRATPKVVPRAWYVVTLPAPVEAEDSRRAFLWLLLHI